MTIERLAIQSAIVTQLELVAGVENVYVDIRVPKTLADFVADFRNSGENAIQMWQVRRIASPSQTAETTRGQIETNAVHFYHRFAVTLFYAFQAGISEAIFQQLVDDVLEQFVNQRSLGAFSSPHPLHLVQIIPHESGSVVGFNAIFEVTVVDPQRALVAV